MFVLAIVAALQVVAPPAPEPVRCPPVTVIPAELRGWATMVPVRAGPTPAPLRIGVGARANLLPGATVVYPLAPAKPGAAGTSGGVFTFEAASAGRYRVVLGGGAWIDVVRYGKALDATAHAHGGECSTMRKMVDFDLPAGRYLLQVSGSPTPILSMMVARLG